MKYNNTNNLTKKRKENNYHIITSLTCYISLKVKVGALSGLGEHRAVQASGLLSLSASDRADAKCGIFTHVLARGAGAAWSAVRALLSHGVSPTVTPGWSRRKRHLLVINGEGNSVGRLPWKRSVGVHLLLACLQL